jgi:hypothetical protein
MKIKFILACLFIFILFFFVNGSFKKNNIENFCKNSFCQIDLNDNRCKCRFQKDDNKYSFDSPETCCDRNCIDLPLDECLENNPFTEVSYYCNVGGSCKKYTGTIVNSHISANNCGNDPLTNQLLLPYNTYEECSKSTDICEKYNVSSNTQNVNKDNCLKDVNCGYCTNECGEGKCISGNATGPSDLTKYYYCNANTKNNNNTYSYGNHVAYLLQNSNKG